MSSKQFKNENPNFAASDKWRLVIGDLILLSRSVHDFSVPGIYSEGIDGPSPGNVMNKIGSERVTFDPVVFTFVIDENWQNWQSIFDWIVGNSKADWPVEKDITIQLLDNLNRPIGLTLILELSRPTSLDNVLLDVDAEVPQLTSTVTFQYVNMTYQRVVKEIDK